MKSKNNNNNNYIDKKIFSKQIVDYTLTKKLAEQKKEPIPIVPDSIAKQFMMLAENLSHSRNFVGYTYRDDMVMDAVENCLKAITKYDPTAPTKSGKPNPFGYFTQISYYAMIRRIIKENKTISLKNKLIDKSVMFDFFLDSDEDTDYIGRQYIDQLRNDRMKD